MNKGDKHHYIPVFYLKQWADANGRVCEFSRPYKHVVPRRTYPDGTGYVRGLYTFNSLPGPANDFIERQLLLRADGLAACVLRRILNEEMDFDGSARSAWSRFLMTLLHRNPERIQQIRHKIANELPPALEGLRLNYRSIRTDSDPESFDEFFSSIGLADLEAANLKLLQMVLDNKAVGEELNRMTWGTIRFNKLRWPLLTSDRPLIMTDGIKHPGAHIVLPISPDRIFFAARSQEVADRIKAICKHDDAGRGLNDLIVKQARKYVYGSNDQQLRFVANRFGHQLRSTPLE